MVSTLKKKASENAPAGHSRLPHPCPSVRLERVSQLLSLMSVTDERRIGYCGGNQCSGPGGLPLSLSCWRSSGAPLQQSGRDRRQTCRISKTSPAISVACTDQTCRKQLGRDRLNSPLARPQRLREPFELFESAEGDASARDRVEWTFRLNPYAGGEVRNFAHTLASERRFGGHRPITIEARLYLNGQYQTLVEEQATIQ
jgi:hypothetical protein